MRDKVLSMVLSIMLVGIMIPMVSFAGDSSFYGVLDAPSNVTAVGVSSSEIKISWSKVSHAEGYYLYRYSSESEDYKLYKKIASGDTTSFTNGGLKPDTHYMYKVRAYEVTDDYTNLSLFSERTSATTKADSVGNPKSVSAKGLSYSEIKVSWSAVAGADGYYLYRYNEKYGEYRHLATIGSGSTTSFINDSLKSDTVRSYRVKAYKVTDGKKVVSDWSARADGKTKKITVSIPSGITAKGMSSTAIKLSWSKVAGASGYYVYRYSKSKDKYCLYKKIGSADTTSYVNKELSFGTRYSYKILAYKSAEGKIFKSKLSEKVAAETSVPDILPPSNVKAKGISTSQIKLSWSKVKKADGYYVYRYSEDAGKYKLYKKIASKNATAFVNDGLAADSAKSYKVKAYITAGGKKVFSPLSKKVRARSDMAKIYATATSISQKKIKVSWNKVKGAKGYNVYRYSSKNNKYVLVKKIKSGSNTTYIQKGLSAGTTKYYKVQYWKYRDGKKVVSEKSDSVQGTTAPRKMHVKAYSYSGGGYTASGRKASRGCVAVDPRVIKMGTKLYIPGYGYGIAADTGGNIKGHTIDVYYPNVSNCYRWGVRYLTISLFE